MQKLTLIVIAMLLSTLLSAQTTYTFTGNGNWSDSNNWLNRLPPPAVLPKTHQIIVDHAAAGSCTLDVPQYISDSAQLTVLTNKKLLIPGNLLINKSELNNHVHVIDTSHLTLVSDATMLSQGIYKFTSPDSLPTIAVNDFIIGPNGEGYIRKVTGVSYARPTETTSIASVLLNTVVAKITDIIKNGVFYIDAPVDNSLQGSSGSALSIVLPARTFPNGPFSITLDNASIVLDPKWHFDYEISNSNLDHFELSCRNATLNANFQVTVAANQAITLVDKSEILKTFTKTFTRWFWVPVGYVPVPVPVTVVMDIDIVLTYSASVGAGVHKTFNMSSTKTWDFGIKYVNNQWQPFYNKTYNHSITSSPTSGEATATLDVAIGPKFSFKLYGAVGPSLMLQLATQSTVNVASPSANWDFAVDGWLKTVLGFDAAILGNNIIDYSHEWNTDPRRLFATPDSVYIASGDGQLGAANDYLAQPVKVKVANSLGNKQPGVLVNFSVTEGGGSVENTSAMTGADGFAETRWKLGATGDQAMQATVSKANGELLKNAPVNFTATVNQDSTFTDPRDGQVYKFKHIGTQVWMIQNLNYNEPGNSWCYGNNAANCSIYGRLYNWFTAQNVAPPGWHLPTQAEWQVLSNYVSGNGGVLKDTTLWNAPNTGATNSFGFRALPGGYRNDFGSFINVGNVCFLWSATPGSSGTLGHYRSLSSTDSIFDGGGIYRYFAFSVRCIRD